MRELMRMLLLFSQPKRKKKKKTEGDLKCNLNIDKWLCGPWSGPLK